MNATSGGVLKIEVETKVDRVSAYIYHETDSFNVTMKHNYLFQSYFYLIKVAKTQKGFIIDSSLL